MGKTCSIYDDFFLTARRWCEHFGTWTAHCLLCWALLGTDFAAAQKVDLPRNKEGLRQVSRVEYAAELTRMTALVESCRVHAGACDAKAVPDDEEIARGAAEGFQAHWGWLRDSLKKAANAGDKDRGTALDAAGRRLGEELQDLGGGSAAVDAAGAQRKAQEVLARAEFRTVKENSWWQTKVAAVERWISDFLGNAVGAVPWSPWMTIAVEWGLLALAVAGLMIWVFRLTRQQRVGVALERVASTAWQAESDDWAVRAKAQAAKGEWREAVHCLYWSAIVMLEGQRLWRQNRARTPREYVGLLEVGSAKRLALARLTGVFERIWYGIRPATGEDYQRASALLEELRVGF